MAAVPTYTPGTYLARITRQQLGKTSKGNPQFVLSFTVEAKVAADGSGNLEQCPVYERSIFRAITDKTVTYLMEDLDYLGIGAELSSFGQLDQDSPQCVRVIDQEIEVVCQHEMYEGQLKERWSLNRGGSGLQIEPVDKQEIRQLDTLFGKQLKARSGGPTGNGSGNGNAAAAQRPAAATGRQPAPRPQGRPQNATPHHEAMEASGSADFEFGANAPDNPDGQPVDDISGFEEVPGTPHSSTPVPAAGPAGTRKRGW